MPVPTATQVLDLWELDGRMSPSNGAIRLLGTIHDPTQVEAMSIAERDRKLFDMRRHMVGEEMELVTNCPGCWYEVAVAATVDDLLSPEIDRAEPITVHLDEAVLQVRMPTAAELSHAAAIDDRDAARAHLVACCLIDGPASILEGPVDAVVETRIVEAVEQAFSETSEIRIGLTCGECGHSWVVEFDIFSYFWIELMQVAQRLLLDVIDLARLYNWSEREILSMSPRRRQAYLEAVL